VVRHSGIAIAKQGFSSHYLGGKESAQSRMKVFLADRKKNTRWGSIRDVMHGERTQNQSGKGIDCEKAAKPGGGKGEREQW